MFGPEYPKIQTLWKRDDRGVILPGDYSTVELAMLQSAPFMWFEKIDGTNIRLHYDGEKVHVGGRTNNTQIPALLLEAMGPILDPAKWQGVIKPGTTVYGEGYGPKIQNGGHYGPEHRFIAFDVLGHRWLRLNEARELLEQIGIAFVPFSHVESPASLSSRMELHWPGRDEKSLSREGRIEGFVGRPLEPLLDLHGKPILVKLKVKDFEALRQKGREFDA